MIINWICKSKDWAFRHLCNHIAKELLEEKHVFDGQKNTSDINFICSPNFLLHGEKADSKTILHIDSNRWYDYLIKHEDKTR